MNKEETFSTHQCATNAMVVTFTRARSYDIFFCFDKQSSFYNAGVGAVNSEVARLAPGDAGLTAYLWHKLIKTKASE
jgi:hypothetical protein